MSTTSLNGMLLYYANDLIPINEQPEQMLTFTVHLHSEHLLYSSTESETDDIQVIVDTGASTTLSTWQARNAAHESPRIQQTTWQDGVLFHTLTSGTSICSSGPGGGLEKYYPYPYPSSPYSLLDY